jgi:hypothetical protein
VNADQDFSRTQEFRDTMMTFVGETRSSFRYLREGMDELRTKGCAKGIEDRERIKALEKAMKAPVRRAVLFASGTGIGVGALVALVKEIWEALKP